MRTLTGSKLHILGVGGTFMSGCAALAQEKGYIVEGTDLKLYPPMDSQLKAKNIKVFEGYTPDHFSPEIQQFIVGNVISRGNPAIEYILDHHLPYISGPQWLLENILKDRHVIAVSGTHGKTTTTSMVTWILEYAGLKPGFLIGGIPENFGVSARLGEGQYFVIEADEYDTAYFDKRAKFVHYHPQTLILNNLEFDHADIYADLNAIKMQFHHLVRTVPQKGLIIYPNRDENIKDVLQKGCWSNTLTFGSKDSDWSAELTHKDGSAFKVLYQGKVLGEVQWSLLGEHNVNNALAALSVAHHLQVPMDQAIKALASFKNVKRRLEIKYQGNGITVYDDFAHHPTAIKTTLAGLRAKIGKARLIGVLEFGSYTMRTGHHKDQLQLALEDADMVICKTPLKTEDWGLAEVLKGFKQPHQLHTNIEDLIKNLTQELKSGDHVVLMSNSGFDGVHAKLVDALQQA